MTVYELIALCKAEAWAGKLDPTEEDYYLQICREYSKKFHTPLHLVIKDLDPAFVIKSYYEEEFAEADAEEHLEKIMDILYTMKDPEYETFKKNEEAEFDKKAVEEERKRIAEGRPIHKAMKNEPTLAPPKDLPKGGMVDLSYMGQNEES